MKKKEGGRRKAKEIYIHGVCVLGWGDIHSVRMCLGLGRREGESECGTARGV